MCAAPGSKTTQLIEMLHADMKVPFPGMPWAGRLEGVDEGTIKTLNGLVRGKPGSVHTAVIGSQTSTHGVGTRLLCSVESVLSGTADGFSLFSRSRFLVQFAFAVVTVSHSRVSSFDDLLPLREAVDCSCYECCQTLRFKCHHHL